MKKIFIAALAAIFVISAASVEAQQPPKQERSNKSGEIRGKDRADQVKQLNDQKPSKGDTKKTQGKSDKKS